MKNQQKKHPVIDWNKETYKKGAFKVPKSFITSYIKNVRCKINASDIKVIKSQESSFKSLNNLKLDLFENNIQNVYCFDSAGKLRTIKYDGNSYLKLLSYLHHKQNDLTIFSFGNNTKLFEVPSRHINLISMVHDILKDHESQILKQENMRSSLNHIVMEGVE